MIFTYLSYLFLLAILGVVIISYNIKNFTKLYDIIIIKKLNQDKEKWVYLKEYLKIWGFAIICTAIFGLASYYTFQRFKCFTLFGYNVRYLSIAILIAFYFIIYKIKKFVIKKIKKKE